MTAYVRLAAAAFISLLSQGSARNGHEPADSPPQRLREAANGMQQPGDTVVSFDVLWRRFCGQTHVPPSDTGMVYGRVALPLGEPADSSTIVQAAWAGDEAAVDPTVDARATVSRVHLRPDGTFGVCGIPLRRSIALRAMRGARNTPVLMLHVDRTRIAHRDLTLCDGTAVAVETTLDSSSRARSAPRVTLAGIVVDGNRHRLAGAQIRIQGVSGIAETDENGEVVLEDVAPGARRVEVDSGSWRPVRFVADLYAGDTVIFTVRLSRSSSENNSAPHDTASSVVGTVLDPAGKPLTGIEVYATSAGRTARTNEAGRYRIEGLVDGPTQVRARRVGWRPADSAVVLAPRSETTLNLAFTDRAAELDTVRISATTDACAARSFAGFSCRRKTSFGVFLDEEKVESLNPRYLADLFDGVPGLRREGQLVVATTGDRCVAYLVNGHPPTPIEAMEIGAHDARDVIAVELYTDHLTTPERYKIFAGHCSLVVLWTSHE
jgi:protocatechuate 3,4-dioxygenase beta subunit